MRRTDAEPHIYRLDRAGVNWGCVDLLCLLAAWARPKHKLSTQHDRLDAGARITAEHQGPCRCMAPAHATACIATACAHAFSNSTCAQMRLTAGVQAIRFYSDHTIQTMDDLLSDVPHSDQHARLHAACDLRSVP